MPDTFYTADNENFNTGGATPTQINHLVWQGLPGVYLAATPDGLMKTVDGGLNWDYLRPNATFGNTWPAGAIGRQVSFSIGPRECPEDTTADCICEDFESGLGNWVFSGSGTHELIAGPSPNTSETLHTVQGVSFSRLPINAGLFPGLVTLSLDVYCSNFHEANGTFTIQISPYVMAFALEWYWNHPNTWHFNGSPLGIDGLIDGQWNHLALTFNQSTGEMISFVVNGVTTEDMAGTFADGDHSQNEFDIVIDTFAPLPDLGGEFYFDNICICPADVSPFQNGFGLWSFSGASDTQNMAFDDLVADDVVVIWGHIGPINGSTPGETPVPTAAGFTFTKRIELIAHTTEKEVIWTATAPIGVSPTFALTMTFPTDPNINGSSFFIVRGRGMVEAPVQAVSNSGTGTVYTAGLAAFASPSNYGLGVQVSSGVDTSNWEYVDSAPFLWSQGGPDLTINYSISNNWAVLALEFTAL